MAHFRSTTQTGDSWRHIRTPGGYEWRRFDAWTPSASPQSPQLFCTILFSQGWPLHAGYMRRYRRYRRRPTANAPPRAGEFPEVRFRVHDGKRMLASSDIAVGIGEFHVLDDGLSIQAGQSLMRCNADGSWTVKLAGAGASASADLAFRPAGAPARPPGMPRSGDHSPLPVDGLHRWMIAQGLFEVSGEIRLSGQATAFTGHGVCDHQFGTTPLLDLRRWVRGVAIEPDRAIVFQFAQSTAKAAQSRVIQIHASGVSELESETLAMESGSFDLLGLAFPALIRVAGRVYATPRRIEQSSGVMTIRYQCRANQSSQLICEFASPARFSRLALLSRFVPIPA